MLIIPVRVHENLTKLKKQFASQGWTNRLKCQRQITLQQKYVTTTHYPDFFVKIHENLKSLQQKRLHHKLGQME